MILAISMPTKFNDYDQLCNMLKDIDCDELTFYEHPLVERYAKEFNVAVQFFKIDWDNIQNSKNVKTNKFGKPYNADAVKDAAHSIVKYASHVCQIDEGDYNIGLYAQKYNLPYIKQPAKIKSDKRYRF